MVIPWCVFLAATFPSSVHSSRTLTRGSHQQWAAKGKTLWQEEGLEQIDLWPCRQVPLHRLSEESDPAHASTHTPTHILNITQNTTSYGFQPYDTRVSSQEFIKMSRTFVSTSHPLEVIGECRLSSNQVREYSHLQRTHRCQRWKDSCPQDFIFLSWFYLALVQDMAAWFYILMRKRWAFKHFQTFVQMCVCVLVCAVFSAVKSSFSFFLIFGGGVVGISAQSPVLLKNTVRHFAHPARLIGSRCCAKPKAYRKHWMAAI